jgi:hypothetical protein
MDLYGFYIDLYGVDFFQSEKMTFLNIFDMYLIALIIFSQYLVRLRMDRSR